MMKSLNLAAVFGGDLSVMLSAVKLVVGHEDITLLVVSTPQE